MHDWKKPNLIRPIGRPDVDGVNRVNEAHIMGDNNIIQLAPNIPADIHELYAQVLNLWQANEAANQAEAETGNGNNLGQETEAPAAGDADDDAVVDEQPQR